MKTIIAGSRSITDIKHVFDAAAACGWLISEVVSGGARGVDTLGEEAGKRAGVPIKVFPADWDTYHKRAGFLRNVQMAEYAEALIAIWDGVSKGTEHMIRIAREKGLRVYVHTVKNEDIIGSFTGPMRFLSNFYPVEIVYEGLPYKSTEAAYQAAKSLDPGIRSSFCSALPGEAKRMGRRIILRPDWEEVRVVVMRDLTALKYPIHSELARMLIATYPAQLIEGNTWGDTFWGKCGGIGQNMLGKTLMERRKTLMEVVRVSPMAT